MNGPLDSMPRSRTWLLKWFAALAGGAGAIAAIVAAIPMLWSWYCAQLPPGLPAGTVGAFGVAVVVAVLTTPRSAR